MHFEVQARHIAAEFLHSSRCCGECHLVHRYEALEEELVRMYDPNANTPRRTEMRNKLVSYEQAFSVSRER
jgi:hypothetical protein